MRIQLDTTEKTIKIEGDVKLCDFIDELKKMLPNGKWKEFKLQTSTTIHNWGNPIYIDRTVPYYYGPWITYNGSTSGTTGYSDGGSTLTVTDAGQAPDFTLTAGVYNLEVENQIPVH